MELTPGTVMLWALAVVVVILCAAAIWGIVGTAYRDSRKRRAELDAIRHRAQERGSR